MKLINLALISLLALGACEHSVTSVVPNFPEIPSGFLGKSAKYGILAGSAVTCTTSGQVDGSVGVWPGSAVTGFPPCEYAGSLNAGNDYAANAQRDLTKVFNFLSNLPCQYNLSPVADIGGKTLKSGVYCAPSSLAVTGKLTLDGDENSAWVFKIGSTLGSSVSSEVVPSGNAQAKNVYWVVGSSATLGTSSKFAGNIIALTSITLNANVKLYGRALARNGAVTLGAGTITLP